MSVPKAILGILSDIPAEVVRPVAALVGGIIRVVRAGDDPRARQDALMRTQEDLKAELDNQRFGPDTSREGPG